MSGSSLNLRQVLGGAAIKQGDTNTRLGYELLDKNSGPMYSDIMSEVDNVTITVILTELKEKVSIVINDAVIKNGTVIFNMPAKTTPGRYDIEIAITVKGQTAVFPSSYANATIEIVKSYFMVDPTDKETKYININELPSMYDVSEMKNELSKLQEEIKNISSSIPPDASENIARIDTDLENIKRTVSIFASDISKKASGTLLDIANENIKNLFDIVDTLENRVKKLEG